MEEVAAALSTIELVFAYDALGHQVYYEVNATDLSPNRKDLQNRGKSRLAYSPHSVVCLKRWSGVIYHVRSLVTVAMYG
jgi:hypothetical protein